MMNSIERLQAFKEFMDACDSKDEKYGGETQLIGWGNPLAPILIVGQEPSCYDPEIQVQAAIQDSNKLIRDCYNNGDLVNLFLQGYDSRNRTWLGYQRLMDFVLYGETIERYNKQKQEQEQKQERERPNQNLPFGTWSFITEMNNTFSKKTKDAEKKLEPRKELFKDSRFIHDFPVVLLACGKKYVELHDGKSDVELIFGVDFDKKYNVQDGEKVKEQHNVQDYFAHYSQDGRLVIHTSHVIALSNDTMRAIAKLIREHLIKRQKFPNHWEKGSRF